MDTTAIEAEISAQSKQVESIALNKGLVSKIDAHIKRIEQKLNDDLVRVSAYYNIYHYLPNSKIMIGATEVTDDVWNSLNFTKVFPNRDTLHEEISFDKSTKGFSFFHQQGRVKYDIGICEEFGGIDTYIRIFEDSREIIKVIGAPTEIKLRTFLRLRGLLSVINEKANHVASEYNNYRISPWG